MMAYGRRCLAASWMILSALSIGLARTKGHLLFGQSTNGPSMSHSLTSPTRFRHCQNGCNSDNGLNGALVVERLELQK
jgi:hypothetical protein